MLGCANWLLEPAPEAPPAPDAAAAAHAAAGDGTSASAAEARSAETASADVQSGSTPRDFAEEVGAVLGVRLRSTDAGEPLAASWAGSAHGSPAAHTWVANSGLTNHEM